MKFSTKIFIFSYCIIMLAMGIGSFILIDLMYSSRVKEIIGEAKADNEHIFMYVVSMYEISDESHMQYAINSFRDKMYGDDGNVFIGQFSDWTGERELEKMNNYEVKASLIKGGDDTYIQVVSRYAEWYMVNSSSINPAIAEREENFRLYRLVLVAASVIMAVILYAFARYVTMPVEKLTKLAKRISNGDYHARINTSYRRMKSREIKQLGEALNRLAVNTESHINELSDMLERRETFMADFTHEIKTPLTSIIGYGDILRTYDVPPDKKREYGEYIYREGRRLERLSFNLLQLIVMGKQELELKRTDMAEVMKRVRGATRFLGEKYGVHIGFKVEDAVIMAEQSLLITAVMNLIDNACKASEKGRSVEVRVEKEEAGCIISVKDEGRGIPADQIEKIMEPFYMVDKSRARKQGGAGIGLSICSKAAKLHGGYIDVKSEEGKGTVMSMHIPLALSVSEETDEKEIRKEERQV